MRKTMKLTPLVCLALLACALMFTACDSGNKEQPPNNTTDGSITENSTTDVATDSTAELKTEAHIHAFGEWTIVKEATCTTEGSQERYCSCGEKQVTSISMIEHTFGEWKVVKSATCTEKGIETRSCPCGEDETRHIDMLAHVEIEAKGQMPTAISNGYAHGTVCENCNMAIKKHTTLHSLKDYVYENTSYVDNDEGKYYFMINAYELVPSIEGVFLIAYSPSNSQITISLVQYPNASTQYVTILTFNDVNATYMTYMYGFYIKLGNYQYYDQMRGQFKVADLYTLEKFSYSDTNTTIGGSSSEVAERCNGYNSTPCTMAKDIILLLDEFLEQSEFGYTTEVYGFTPNA